MTSEKAQRFEGSKRKPNVTDGNSETLVQDFSYLITIFCAEMYARIGLRNAELLILLINLSLMGGCNQEELAVLTKYVAHVRDWKMY